MKRSAIWVCVLLSPLLVYAASTSTVPWQSGGSASDFGSLSEYNDTSDPNDYTYYNDGTARRITVLNLLKALESPLTGFEISADNLPDIYGVLGDPTPWRLFYSNGSGVLTELEFGAAGTSLISNGVDAAPSWDVVSGSGVGGIAGSTGSTDNAILTADGTGGSTLQATTATISDTGTMNIPSGQTYNINGTAHTHNYQPADADLTTWAGVTPSANGQSLVALANYAAMLAALGGQPLDADLTALAGQSWARGDVIYYGAAGLTRLAKGTSGQVLKMATNDPVWGTDNNDGGSGISRWDQLLAPTADLSLATGAYKSNFTSSMDLLGPVWTISNTTNPFTYTTSLIDFKLTANGDGNGFFLRGYDNSGNDLKWSIGPEGAIKGYSFETWQSTTGGVLDLLEGAANGTNYVRFKVPDSIASNVQIDVPAVSGSLVVEGNATGGLLFGDSSPDSAGEIAYASTQLIFHDGTAARNVAKAGTLTNTKWCTSDGTVINCATDAPAGSGDFLADGSVPMTGALVSTGNQNIGSTSAEAGNVYLKDGAVIYGQNDQSATLTSSAGKWTANALGVTGAATVGTMNGHTFTTGSSTFTGTAGQVYTFPTTTATIARTDAANTFTGHQTIEGVTSTGATGTGKFVFDNTPTLVTPNIGAATGTSLLATGIVDGATPITLTEGDSANIGGTYKSGYTFNGNANIGNATTYTLPTAAAGLQFCIKNIDGRTGVLRLNTSAAGQYIDLDGTVSASGGYLTSGGAAGDGVCVVGVSNIYWVGYTQKGTWTVH